jgi:hypothetical protein
MLQAENDRVNNILKGKQGEIEDWKTRHNKLENSIKNYSYVEQEKNALQGRLNDQVKAGEELQFAVKKLER